MPPNHPSSAHETEQSSQNTLFRMQGNFRQAELLAVTPEDLNLFTALYEKHTGIRLAQGDATVKSQRLISLVRLIAPYAERNPDLEAPTKL